MKIYYIFILSILSLLFTNCNSNNDYRITSERVGNFEIGCTLKEFYEKYSDYQITEILGIGWTSRDKYFEIYKDQNKLLDLFFRDNKLIGINVWSNKYKTNKLVCTDQTAQNVVDKGYQIGNPVERDDYYIYRVSERNISGNFIINKRLYFCFEKISSKSGKIGKYAKLKMISIGEEFNVKKGKGQINFGKFHNCSYQNDIINLTIDFNDQWTKINPEKSKYGSDGNNDLFNISNQELDINIRFNIEPIREKVIDTINFLKRKSHFLISTDPWDFYKVNHFAKSNEDIQSFYTNYNLKVYYTIDQQKVENSKIRYTVYIATIFNDYIMWINGKYFNKENLNEIFNIIKKIKSP